MPETNSKEWGSCLIIIRHDIFGFFHISMVDEARKKSKNRTKKCDYLFDSVFGCFFTKSNRLLVHIGGDSLTTAEKKIKKKVKV